MSDVNDYTIYASKPSSAAKTSREMERFLIREDDGTLAEQAKQELESLGYRVHGVMPGDDDVEATEPRTRRSGR